MHHGAILNIRPVSDPDVVHISTEHTSIPNARILANLDITDDDSILCDESRRMYLWYDSSVWFYQGHADIISQGIAHKKYLADVGAPWQNSRDVFHECTESPLRLDDRNHGTLLTWKRAK